MSLRLPLCTPRNDCIHFTASKQLQPHNRAYTTLHEESNNEHPDKRRGLHLGRAQPDA
jgi:hypothetical protein